MPKALKLFFKVLLGFLAALIISAFLLYGYVWYTTNQAITESAQVKDSSMVAGNPDGDVTVVEFVDYRCPHCPVMNKTLMDAVKADGNVKVIIRPVGWVDEQAMPVSTFVLATARQDKMVELHERLMALGTKPDIGTAQTIAASIGVDVGTALELSRTKEIEQEVWDNQTYAINAGFRGVPALLINGRMYQPQDEQAMTSINGLLVAFDESRTDHNK